MEGGEEGKGKFPTFMHCMQIVTRFYHKHQERAEYRHPDDQVVVMTTAIQTIWTLEHQGPNTSRSNQWPVIGGTGTVGHQSLD